MVRYGYTEINVHLSKSAIRCNLQVHRTSGNQRKERGTENMEPGAFMLLSGSFSFRFYFRLPRSALTLFLPTATRRLLPTNLTDTPLSSHSARKCTSDGLKPYTSHPRFGRSRCTYCFALLTSTMLSPPLLNTYCNTTTILDRMRCLLESEYIHRPMQLSHVGSINVTHTLLLGRATVSRWISSGFAGLGGVLDAVSPRRLSDDKSCHCD